MTYIPVDDRKGFEILEQRLWLYTFSGGVSYPRCFLSRCFLMTCLLKARGVGTYKLFKMKQTKNAIKAKCAADWSKRLTKTAVKEHLYLMRMGISRGTKPYYSRFASSTLNSNRYMTFKPITNDATRRKPTPPTYFIMPVKQ